MSQQKFGNDFVMYAGELPATLRNIQKFFVDNETNYGYGHTTRNELIKDLDTGIIYDNRKTKGLFIDGSYRDTLSRHYAVIPDQRIEGLIQPLLNDGRIQLDLKEKSKNGLATQWTYKTDETFRIKHSGGNGENDDIFTKRFTVRNSVNGGIALSILADVYRQICSNGLMGWGAEHQIRIFHIGNIEDKVAKFRDYIDDALERSERAAAILQQATLINVNEETMQFIVDKSNISKNWLPDWLSLDESKYKVQHIAGGSHTLYETANDITWKLSRSNPQHREHGRVKGTLSFLQRSTFERGLSKALTEVVEKKRSA